MINEEKILGIYADQGFSLEEPDDFILFLRYKGKLITKFSSHSQIGTKRRKVRGACKQFLNKVKDITFDLSRAC